MKLYKHLVFDTSNIFLRAFNGITIKDEAPKLAANMVKKIIRENAGPKCSFYFLCDNWNSNPSTNFVTARKSIDSQYKANRTYDPKVFHGIAVFKNWLKTIPNSCIIQEPQREADDLLLGVMAKTGNDFVLLVSADLDWACEMSRERHWFNFDQIFTPSDFEAKYKYPATRNSILLHKTFRGDKSDNIPNPNTRIKEEDLLQLILSGKTLPEIIQDPPSSLREAIVSHKDRLLKNWELLNPLF